MGKTYRQLKTENKKLRQQMDEMKATYIAKNGIEPGTLVLIKTNDPWQGVTFGVQGVKELQGMLSQMARGPVTVVCTQKEYGLETIKGTALVQLRDACNKLIEMRGEGARYIPIEPPRLTADQSRQLTEEGRELRKQLYKELGQPACSCGALKRDDEPCKGYCRK